MYGFSTTNLSPDTLVSFFQCSMDTGAGKCCLASWRVIGGFICEVTLGKENGFDSIGLWT
jgi:hypothetical protein